MTSQEPAADFNVRQVAAARLSALPWQRLVTMCLLLYGATGVLEVCMGLIIDPLSEFSPLMPLASLLVGGAPREVLWSAKGVLQVLTQVLALVYAWRFHRRRASSRRQVLQIGSLFALLFTIALSAEVSTLDNYAGALNWALSVALHAIWNLVWLAAIMTLTLRADRLERPATWIVIVSVLALGMNTFFSSVAMVRWWGKCWACTAIPKLFETPPDPGLFNEFLGDGRPQWVNIWGSRIEILEGLTQDAVVIATLVWVAMAIMKRRMARSVAWLVVAIGLSDIVFLALQFSIGYFGFAGEGPHVATWTMMSCHPAGKVLLGVYLWKFLGTLREGPNYPVCCTCGYNLTGNASCRCPECGTAVDSASTPKPNEERSRSPRRGARA